MLVALFNADFDLLAAVCNIFVESLELGLHRVVEFMVLLEFTECFCEFCHCFLNALIGALSTLLHLRLERFICVEHISYLRL